METKRIKISRSESGQRSCVRSWRRRSVRLLMQNNKSCHTQTTLNALVPSLCLHPRLSPALRALGFQLQGPRVLISIQTFLQPLKVGGTRCLKLRLNMRVNRQKVRSNALPLQCPPRRRDPLHLRTSQTSLTRQSYNSDQTSFKLQGIRSWPALPPPQLSWALPLSSRFQI